MEHTGFLLSMIRLDLQQGKKYFTAYKQESIISSWTHILSINAAWIHLSLHNFKGKQEECQYIREAAPVVPQTWYHICVGIDTVSGLLQIADNGILVSDEEKDILKNTSSIKPESVRGKLLGRLGILCMKIMMERVDPGERTNIVP